MDIFPNKMDNLQEPLQKKANHALNIKVSSNSVQVKTFNVRSELPCFSAALSTSRPCIGHGKSPNNSQPAVAVQHQPSDRGLVGGAAGAEAI